MADLKVYAWAPGGGRGRAIVAAPSFAAAQRAVATTRLRQMPTKDYVSIGGNPHDLRVALAEPGVVFVAEDQWGRDYEPAPARQAPTEGSA